MRLLFSCHFLYIPRKVVNCVNRAYVLVTVWEKNGAPSAKSLTKHRRYPEKQQSSHVLHVNICTKHFSTMYTHEKYEPTDEPIG